MLTREGKKMFLKSMLAMLVGFVFMVEEAEGQTKKVSNNPHYLGSEPSKAYYFPWLVTFHREFAYSSEFFGSGSILTDLWVISSMDSFVRKSTSPRDPRPFYQVIDDIAVYSGGVWGSPFDRGLENSPVWLQKRKVSVIKIFTHPHTIAAHVEQFSRGSAPRRLNDLDRSPFGFSMSVCIVRITNSYGGNREEWEWRRLTLPIPLFADRAATVKIRLKNEIRALEKSPYETECYVGGFRLGDYRLVQHRVVYVPFEQCEAAYCGYDHRACLNWPVNETHVCFKSLTYDDMCWMDQGSALYCKSISDSVIAVLTSGPTCGYDGLPGVYTLIHHALELFERVNPGEPYVPLSRRELTRYTPPPERDMFPAYR